MKISGVCNGTLTIQANVNKKGDYALARKVAEQMVKDSNGDFVIGSECDREQWVQICAAWEQGLADDLRYTYKAAKFKVGWETVYIERNIDGEFRVPAPCGTEAGSYYTEDREDAKATAAILWKEQGNVEFKIKSVQEHSA